MKHIKTYENFDNKVNESYREDDRIRLNQPCTIYNKSKKHLRDVIITGETKDSLTYHKNGKPDKKHEVLKKDIVDISYQDE